ncbi:transcriptional regulator, TetR family [Chitinophaga terrae (ex Kim and Jung 2007)]|jgi:AcrR family transcriptional regulator|uniref:Transcriptional regulator, TetR family n=1 Tax=Chitinophaga terrae (ex Kim and Jung 2007) TaxID=408074 RepID=A0A1H4BB86_9BACT|nr:TetR/AcrR family transcriptional regulator [Chitinophaga terrae (ex Kim and Jung 2007)]MDQ0106245.1 AcrR family transcriptional regulator [Chitinophaga terrae (ex Kim and Jung 2007)]GEP92115.1 TetR family transcriptional regulator [Chitinophaga terrae (ex Kim and Jung 2007)]SEA45314.1 transcriptional regulator, TetR family [Chitinophaga terrae (ex Kim and Jung 2007)]
MPREKKVSMDASTEERIIAAARIVFTRKGYESAKIRDIAAEADINLSLVNYYFRSKEKLFQLVMSEVVEQLFTGVTSILNDRNLSLHEKIEQLVSYYTALLLQNPNFPLFMVNELFSGGDTILKGNRKDAIFQSHFFQQLAALQANGKLSVNPLHILVNLIGFMVMPFLARPLLDRSNILNPEAFKAFIEDRKQLIPLWIKSMLK